MFSQSTQYLQLPIILHSVSGSLVVDTVVFLRRRKRDICFGCDISFEKSIYTHLPYIMKNNVEESITSWVISCTGSFISQAEPGRGGRCVASAFTAFALNIS